MSIVFIGTPEFAVPSLRRLAEIGVEVTAVYTQPDRPAGRGRQIVAPPVKVAAEGLGLPVYQPETLRDPAVVEHLRSLAPEAMIGVAYGQIIRREVLDIAPKGVLNVHPSLLPRWRGASPIAGAILGGDEETGVTIMLMDAGMDTGPILSQVRVPLGPDATAGTLTASLAEIGANLLVDTLPRWLAGKIEPKPQDDSQATATSLVRKEDGAINWTLPAAEIARRVRAYNPWPGAHTLLAGEQVTIWQAKAIAGSGDPGTIVSAPEGFGVATIDGQLIVLEAQRAGRTRLPAGEFLRGMPSLIGRKFDSTDT